MNNGTLVSREQMLLFVQKYENELGILLDVNIVRPYTNYMTPDKQVVCWIHDNACMGDPDNTARDHYIRHDLVGFKTTAEEIAEVRQKAIQEFPLEMGAIIGLDLALEGMDKTVVSVVEYVDNYKIAVLACAEKLKPKKKGKKNADETMGAKTSGKATVAKGKGKVGGRKSGRTSQSGNARNRN
jgi:hypothetical protein